MTDRDILCMQRPSQLAFWVSRILQRSAPQARPHVARMEDPSYALVVSADESIETATPRDELDAVLSGLEQQTSRLDDVLANLDAFTTGERPSPVDPALRRNLSDFDEAASSTFALGPPSGPPPPAERNTLVEQAWLRASVLSGELRRADFVNAWTPGSGGRGSSRLAPRGGTSTPPRALPVPMSLQPAAGADGTDAKLFELVLDAGCSHTHWCT